MPDIVLKDRNGNKVTHEGVIGVKMLNADEELETFYSKENARPFDCLRVTFMNGDRVVYVRSVADGDNCADPVERGLIDIPTKESDDQYNYTFYGWGEADGGAVDDTILHAVTADKTVYAIFTATVRLYTITFLDSDGVTLLTDSQQLAYDTVPSYTPKKNGYIFDGWEPEIVPVTKDAEYVAKWTVGIVVDGTIILPLTTVSTAADSNFSPMAQLNTPARGYTSDGTELVVVWNDVEYPVIVRTIFYQTGSSGGGVTLKSQAGNPHQVTKYASTIRNRKLNSSTGASIPDTGEPFMVMLYDAQIRIFTAAATTATVMIYRPN